MIRRRKAIKNIGLITGGILTLPYHCSFEPQISYSNFPLLKKKEQDLIAAICDIILPTDFNNFPTLETREHFVLTMINDCLDNEKRIEFSVGLNSFQNEIFEVKKMSVEIETNNGPGYGRTIADWFNVTDKKKNINVAVNGDPDRFFKLITERLKFFD